MKKILVAGDINVDLICSGYHAFPAPGKEVLVDDFVMTLGGSSAVCAMGLARLGNPVAFIGKVGADSWGDYCIEATFHDEDDEQPASTPVTEAPPTP